MFNVIILSSGQSTRLKPITNNIPKVLVNVGTDTALLQQSNFWTQHKDLDKIYVVVHPKYVHMVEEYCIENSLDKIEIVAEPDSNGSFEAIRNVVRYNPHLEKNVFLNWGDLIPIKLGDANSYRYFSEFTTSTKNIIFIKVHVPARFPHIYFSRMRRVHHLVTIFKMLFFPKILH